MRGTCSVRAMDRLDALAARQQVRFINHALLISTTAQRWPPKIASSLDLGHSSKRLPEQE